MEQDGFSLLELLCVLLILVSGLSLSVPAFSAVRERAALRRDLATLKGTLEHVAARSVQEFRELSVRVSSSSYSTETTSTQLSSPTVTTNAPIEIRFSPSGAVSPKTLILARGRLRCSLTVSLRGRMRELCF